MNEPPDFGADGLTAAGDPGAFLPTLRYVAEDFLIVGRRYDRAKLRARIKGVTDPDPSPTQGTLDPPPHGP